MKWERKHALQAIEVSVLPNRNSWVSWNQREKGRQHKFPRVLKGKMLDDWKMFLQKEQIN